ncbi:MAG: hypothetical protein LAT57_14510 [Balneolales bacterium]|nr:hypothetical protein [Balneolales bacterium]
MKTFPKLYFLLPAVLLFWTGCNTLSPDANDLTDEEIEIASQIITESLTDQSGGMLTSLYDALSNVSAEGIRYDDGSTTIRERPNITPGQKPENPGQANGRGAERDFTASYNPETGEHLVRFTRSFQGPVVTMSQTVQTVYIYTDVDGNFLEYPRRQRDQIESIAFSSQRNGTQTSPRRNARSSRADTLLITGISSASASLSLDGVHQHSGEMSINLPRAERSVERAFTNRFAMQDIRIDKAIVRENGNLEEGVTGIITYSLKMVNNINGELKEREVEGVIEMNGDGTALLRFSKVDDIFNIALYSAETN